MFTKHSLYSEFIHKHFPPKMDLNGHQWRRYIEAIIKFGQINPPEDPLVLEDKPGIVLAYQARFRERPGLGTFWIDHLRTLMIKINDSDSYDRESATHWLENPENPYTNCSNEEKAEKYLEDKGASETARKAIDSCYVQNDCLPFWPIIWGYYENKKEKNEWYIARAPERDSTIVVNEDSVSMHVRCTEIEITSFPEGESFKCSIDLTFGTTYKEDGNHIESIKFGNNFTRLLFTFGLPKDISFEELKSLARKEGVLLNDREIVEESTEQSASKPSIYKSFKLDLLNACISLFSSGIAQNKILAPFGASIDNNSEVEPDTIDKELDKADRLIPYLKSIIAAKEQVDEAYVKLKEEAGLDLNLLINLKIAIRTLLDAIEQFESEPKFYNSIVKEQLDDYRTELEKNVREFNRIAQEIYETPELMEQVKAKKQFKTLAALSPIMYGLKNEYAAERILNNHHYALENPSDNLAQIWKLSEGQRNDLISTYPNSLRIHAFKDGLKQANGIRGFNYPITNDHFSSVVIVKETNSITPTQVQKYWPQRFFGNELLKDLNGKEYVTQKENNINAALSVKDLAVLRDVYQHASDPHAFLKTSLFYQEVATMDLANLRKAYKEDITVRNLLALDCEVALSLAMTNVNVATVLFENTEAFNASQLTAQERKLLSHMHFQNADFYSTISSKEKKQHDTIVTDKSVSSYLHKKQFSKIAADIGFQRVLKNTDTQGFINLVTAFSKKTWFNRGAGALQTQDNETILVSNICHAVNLINGQAKISSTAIKNIAGMLSHNAEARNAAFALLERKLTKNSYSELNEKLIQSLVTLACIDETGELAMSLLKNKKIVPHLNRDLGKQLRKVHHTNGEVVLLISQTNQTQNSRAPIASTQQLKEVFIGLFEPTDFDNVFMGETRTSEQIAFTNKKLMHKAAKHEWVATENLINQLKGKYSYLFQLNYPLSIKQQNELAYYLATTPDLPKIDFLPHTPFAAALEQSKMLTVALKDAPKDVEEEVDVTSANTDALNATVDQPTHNMVFAQLAHTPVTPTNNPIEEIIENLADEETSIEDIITELDGRWDELLNNETFKTALLDDQNPIHERSVAIVKSHVGNLEVAECLHLASEHPIIVSAATQDQLSSLFTDIAQTSAQSLVDWIICMPTEYRLQFMSTPGLRENLAGEESLQNLKELYDAVNDVAVFLGSDANTASSLAQKVLATTQGQDERTPIEAGINAHLRSITQQEVSMKADARAIDATAPHTRGMLA